jgi:hypothetical protein
MEVLSARWDMFELGVDLPKWVKPSSHTKQMRIHYIPLSDAAIELIGDLRERRRSKVLREMLGDAVELFHLSHKLIRRRAGR